MRRLGRVERGSESECGAPFPFLPVDAWSPDLSTHFVYSSLGVVNKKLFDLIPESALESVLSALTQKETHRKSPAG